MEIQVKKGKPFQENGDVLIFPVYEEEIRSGELKLLDRQNHGKISGILDSGEFGGKKNETVALHALGGLKTRKLLLVGLGPVKKGNLDTIREAFGKAAGRARAMGAVTIVSGIRQELLKKEKLRDIAQAMTEGVLLGLYQFTLYKTELEEEAKEIRTWVLAVEDGKKVGDVEKGASVGKIISEGVALARDLGNEPSNAVTPSRLAEEARKIGHELDLRVTVLDRQEMEELKMGSFLGVARGSEEPPKFIIMEYSPVPKARPLVLIGKSITFDSGGISLKPAEKMEQMKGDMSGGAAVLATLKVAAQLKLPLNLVGILPATENLPSGTATKPGDILTSLSGKTIEVINTDAEGRLVLADALTYAQRFRPTLMIDLATLTGAVVVALGGEAIGMLGTSDPEKEKLRRAGEKCGERVWELPLWEKYYDLIKSDVADMKNTGGRSAGTITAAAFLSKFTGDTPWVHLDIAGTAWTESDHPYIPKGNSGCGVRLLMTYLMDSLKH